MALDLSSLSDVGALLRAQDEGKGLRRVRVDAIHPDPNQPRKTFDEESLAELAESIRAIGIIQPPVVRSRDDGYLLIAGERRWRAARQLGLEIIDVIVRDDLNARAQMIENIQREALSLWEIYRVIAGEIEAGTSQAELARALGKSGTWVAAYVAISRMPDTFVSLLKGSRITDITTVGNLCRLYQEKPQAAEALLRSQENITRATVAKARTHRSIPLSVEMGQGSSPPRESRSEGNAATARRRITPVPDGAHADAPVNIGPPQQQDGLSALSVRIGVLLDEATWIVDYTRQREVADRVALVRMEGSSTHFCEAPIEALKLQFIEYQ